MVEVRNGQTGAQSTMGLLGIHSSEGLRPAVHDFTEKQHRDSWKQMTLVSACFLGPFITFSLSLCFLVITLELLWKSL